MDTVMQEIARVTKEHGELLATALVQRKGNMHVVLVKLNHEEHESYATWLFSQWPDRPGYTGEGHYFHARGGSEVFRLKAFDDAFQDFVKRSLDMRVYLRSEIDAEARVPVPEVDE